MRPAKAVLLVHGDPHALGILSLVLSTRGYRVAAVASAGLALRELALGPFDALAAELSVRCDAGDGNQLALEAKRLQPGLPVLLFSRRVSALGRASHADAFLPKFDCAPLALLERLRILCARKRGPKKGSSQCSGLSDQGKVITA